MKTLFRTERPQTLEKAVSVIFCGQINLNVQSIVLVHMCHEAHSVRSLGKEKRYLLTR